jgi:hypothetical protein
MTLIGGTLETVPDRLIALSSPNPSMGFFEAQEAQRTLSEHARVTWHIQAGAAVPEDRMGLSIEIDPGVGPSDVERQTYRLTIDGRRIRIQAPDAAGAFYGVMTLTQLARQYGDRLPQLRIDDSPDFVRRGAMLDVSRDKVPTMKTLFELVDVFAGLKLNELQLYTEHTFAFQRHPLVWAAASPLTGEEIMQLDAYCRARHIDLVPNQNCFGHMRRWLIHDAYRHLAECPDGCSTRWGVIAEPFTLCPGDPGSIALVAEMFDELLPHFTSSLFNVGCDETVDLGSGRSMAEVEARGVGRVYLDFVLKIHALVRRYGRTMQFWGDIIMEHPELVPELPRDAVAMEWGYEADHPFADHGAKFAAAGIPFYVVPGTSTWNSLGGRTDNAIGNLLNAAENGLRNGAIGYLITDWGDRGHLQPLPVSFLPFAFGAAVSWCQSENRNIDLARRVSLHLFGDPTGATGQFAYDLGNVSTKIPGRIHNAAAYALGVVLSDDDLRERITGVTIDRAVIKRVNKELDRLERIIPGLKIGRDDAALIKREFAYAMHLIRCGMDRLAREKVPALAMDERARRAARRKAVAEHEKVWRARNRIGGMRDSLGNFRF